MSTRSPVQSMRSEMAASASRSEWSHTAPMRPCPHEVATVVATARVRLSLELRPARPLLGQAEWRQNYDPQW